MKQLILLYPKELWIMIKTIFKLGDTKLHKFVYKLIVAGICLLIFYLYLSFISKAVWSP